MIEDDEMATKVYQGLVMGIFPVMLKLSIGDRFYVFKDSGLNLKTVFKPLNNFRCYMFSKCTVC